MLRLAEGWALWLRRASSYLSQLGGLQTVLCGQAGSLSRLPCQLGLQTMLHGCVGSLAGLPARAWLQAVFSTWAGP